MTEVFNVIFDMFGTVIGLLKQIPITQNVSLFDFSVAILILTIASVAFVSVVAVGNTGNASFIQRAVGNSEARHADARRARALENDFKRQKGG